MHPQKLGFAKVWLSASFSNLADGLFLIGAPLVALTVTDSPALIAGLRVAQTLPWFVLGLFVGVLVDRVDRRVLAIYAELLRGSALMLVAAVAAFGELGLPVLYLAVALAGVAETVADTSTQTLVPMVVPAERRRRANGRLMATQMVMNDFVGAPLGSLLVAGSVAVAFAVPGGLYLGAGLILLTLAGRFSVGRAKRQSVAVDIREGLGVLVRGSVIARLTLYAVVTNLTNTAFFAVFVVYAVGSGSILGLSGFGYSLLLIAAAVGAISGALTADRVARVAPTSVLLTTAVLALAVCFATPYLVRQPVVIGAAFVLSGFAMAVGSVVNTSLRQDLVPIHLFGRVAAGLRFLTFGARPVGALAGGLVAEAITPTRLFGVLAVLVLPLVLVTARLRVPEAAPADTTAPDGSQAG
ncbi:MFS transporter [Streptomyces sp. 8K308]|uniref:MFS transporter n=1 Tax=Streptomyces sp. 8K308 TaxID=2530388 RepID=UPI00140476A5|nr:MFS transporter [Streptomyces sp. 8K308]